MIFENIKNINVDEPATWKGKIFLTFDVEWCSDEVLSSVLDILEKYSLRATLFVTHETELLPRMRANENLELGIHPNFNFLLDGDSRQGGNVLEVVEYYSEIVPEAISFRSHSLTQSSKISTLMTEKGFLYECNNYVPSSSGIELSPYRHANGEMIRVPHFWEDDLHCLNKESWDTDLYLANQGIKVFDFHPILVFLNCMDINEFETVKHHSNNIEALRQNINTERFGVGDFLSALITGKMS